MCSQEEQLVWWIGAGHHIRVVAEDKHHIDKRLSLSLGVYPEVEQLSSLNISKGCQCPISAYIERDYPKGSQFSAMAVIVL